MSRKQKKVLARILASSCFLTVPLPTLQFQSCLGGGGIFLTFLMSPLCNLCWFSVFLQY